MKSGNLHRSVFSILLPIGLLFFGFIVYQWSGGREDIGNQWNSAIENKNTQLQNFTSVEVKQKGVHVFGSMETMDFQPLIQNNVEWVTLVAWGFQAEHDSQIMNHHNGDSTSIRKNNAELLERIALVKAAGLNVFIKPHIWMDTDPDDKWRSDIFPANEENWALWKKSYTDYIFRYARLAEQGKAEMFCIGTELSRLSVEKPAFWQALIQEVRKIYSGKITYAANWYNEYEKITFWEKLDYIGIQAYFPLVKNENPTVQEISIGWKKYFPTLKSMAKKYNRKILFTEMGYKSTTDSAIKPWEWMDDPSRSGKTLSVETQANCYQAFFNAVWKKDWFAGVHIWQLRSDYPKRYKTNNLDFTPRGKPAEEIIAKGFE